MSETSIISLTPAAIEHIKTLLAKEPNSLGFRLSIKKTGCSGYAYVPSLIEKINENDFYFQSNDLSIYVDRACEEFVKGLVIDYIAETVGLKQKRLVFINPNEKNRCGCGESFTIE